MLVDLIKNKTQLYVACRKQWHSLLKRQIQTERERMERYSPRNWALKERSSYIDNWKSIIQTKISLKRKRRSLDIGKGKFHWEQITCKYAHTKCQHAKFQKQTLLDIIGQTDPNIRTMGNHTPRSHE